MICPKCGFGNEEDSLYCKKCGNAIKSQKRTISINQIEKVNCEVCGKEYAKNEKSCPYCRNIERTKKWKKYGLLIICAGIVIVALLGYGLWAYFTKYYLSEDEKLEVQKTIATIDAIGIIDHNSEDRILQAEMMYADLSPKCQKHVTNADVLATARPAYDSIRAKEAIDAIEAIGTVTMTSETDIAVAEEIYAALSDDQKVLVTNSQKLADAPHQLKAAKALYVDEQIDGLGEITVNSRLKLTTVRKLYEELNDDEKAYVQKYEILVRAEEEYDKACIERCEKLIDSIGEVTLYSEASIKTARNAYNELRNDLQTEVENKTLLFNSERLYNDLVEEKRIADEQQRIADNTIKAGTSFEFKDSAYGIWQVSVKSVKITDRINPDDTSGYYYYKHPQDPDEIFIDIALRVKNTGTNMQAIEPMVGKCTIEYGDRTITKNYTLLVSNGSYLETVYSWDGLGALKTCTMHVAIVMPKECRTDGKNIRITLEFGNQEKYIQVR